VLFKLLLDAFSVSTTFSFPDDDAGSSPLHLTADLQRIPDCFDADLETGLSLCCTGKMWGKFDSYDKQDNAIKYQTPPQQLLETQ
jgi:hypothetical protein